MVTQLTTAASWYDWTEKIFLVAHYLRLEFRLVALHFIQTSDHIIIELVEVPEGYEESNTAYKHALHAAHIRYPVEHGVAFTRYPSQVSVHLNCDVLSRPQIFFVRHFFFLFKLENRGILKLSQVI